MSCNVFQMDVFARLGRARCILRRDARDAFCFSAETRLQFLTNERCTYICRRIRLN